MRKRYDLSLLDWRLAGLTPESWRYETPAETGVPRTPEVGPVPARVPGSVQAALREAGLLPDWNVGLDSRACEWVEHRQWMFHAELPGEWLEPGRTHRLVCEGLDGFGRVHLGGAKVGEFANAFVPHVFDLTAVVRAAAGSARPSGEARNVLALVFDPPPRWLGQFGFTSKMTEWKPRFNYTWDWTPRLVQLGVWDDAYLEVTDGVELGELRCAASFDAASGSGALHVRAAAGPTTSSTDDGGARVEVVLLDGDSEVMREEVSPERMASGVEWKGLAVEPWWPNGEGERPLYTLRAELRTGISGGGGEVLDSRERRLGFRSVTWESCDGAPAGADPWVCVVNGRRMFLQGVNWTPIRPNFADVGAGEYRKRIEVYAGMGLNVLRVWGGAVLERETFYDLCDEHGLLVWQEFPLSSSGAENWPPENEASMEALSATARSYVARRRHHPSLLLWCGGNELQGSVDGRKTGTGKPVDLGHPLIRRFADVVAEEDPGRRFLPTSASGPRFVASEEDFGKGLHWDVHGPWRAAGATLEDEERYWANDDALFRSELGAPGASPVDVIERCAGGLPALPATLENPLWRRSSWWIDWHEFVAEKGREPGSLAEYVEWSQARQADVLARAVGACRRRFPAIGGVILWMGHDCFPCMANTSVLDFHGRPKPAAEAVARALRGEGDQAGQTEGGASRETRSERPDRR